MTKLLNNAFERVSSLDEIEQNIFARFILDEVESETKWNKSFASSEDILLVMADEAISDFNSKKTEVMDMEKL